MVHGSRPDGRTVLFFRLPGFRYRENGCHDFQGRIPEEHAAGCPGGGYFCGRAGGEKANIPDNMKMEVDHIRPWSEGGSDEMWNLQPLCKPCNRSKSNNTTFKDNIKIIKNDLVHGDLVKSGVKKSLRGNKILKGLGITVENNE